MKQVFQNIVSGASEVVDVPVPRASRGHLLINSTRSLISAGTERSLVEFGKAGYLEKARKQPDKVKMVLDKVRTDGIVATFESVRSKLAEPLSMGYSNVGTVVDVGDGVQGFAKGDRVLSNGPHAEFVSVPTNLCVRIPDAVDDDSAAFGTVGAIALQGVRLANPTLGETFVVTGLGLIGLLTVQILRANGCSVIGLDFDPARLDLAASYGAEVVRLDQGQDPVAVASLLTGGIGVDGVIVTATTSSDDVMHQAATMCRKRGRIILVGVVGLQLRRSDFYEKELTFQVSCSYGPGRYDPSYEDHGHDYPLPFVRWTENRNMQAVLDLMDAGAVKVDDLISARFRISDAPEAYRSLVEDETSLGVVFEYPESESDDAPRTIVLADPEQPPAGAGVVGAIGAGNYAGRILLPAFREAGGRLKAIASSQGTSSAHVGSRLGFETNTTDVSVIFDDPEIDVVVIGTRHDSHARLVVDALRAGKHVFVEKPLALAHEQLNEIESARRQALEHGSGGRVMVGFNRRFAPLVGRLEKEVSRSSAPISLVYTCNAGAIPAESWVHHPSEGGGRIVGEACHFIDLARALVGHAIVDASMDVMDDPRGLGDTASISLRFADGSIATVHYFANGHRSFPKERIEVFQGGRVLTLDNFRSVRGFGASLRKRRWTQDKGQEACVQAFMDAVRSGGDDPIPFDQLMEVARVTLDLAAEHGTT